MKMKCFAGFAVVLAVTAGAAVAEVPRGWTWMLQRPFRDITVAASSEQADRWPAAKAIDGDTSEPEGIWQTLRDSPESAWLELRLRGPRRVKGVRIYHQDNPRYYRSVDYAIACWVDGAWQTVATVEENKTAGWREHVFEPVETAKVRITITKAEYGNRMGLNEVELVLEAQQASGEERRERLSAPYRCGDVVEMGLVSFRVNAPDGTSVELSTRTAADEGGQPGAWSAWSAAYGESPARITSPLGQWIQCRAVFHDFAEKWAEVDGVTLGWPGCTEQIDPGVLVPRPGEPLSLCVRFDRTMDRGSSPRAEIDLPGQPGQVLANGAWDEAGHTWRFEAVTPGAEQGVAQVVVGGARTAEGALMLHESISLAIGEEPLLDRLRAIAEWMMEHPHKAIFVEGYNQRTILGLYEITREERYLAHVREWAQRLLEYQKPEGYWPTGYGNVYFADTGSALGLLINFYKFATTEERTAIDTALQRYADLLLVRGDSQGRPFVHEDGSLGVGFRADTEGNIEGDLNKPYTIATGLTGAEIFAAMYYMSGEEQYETIAVKACDWLLDTMAPSGQIPYYIDDWNPGRKDQQHVWERWPYDTSAYAGEGFIAAWTYIEDAAFHEELGERVAPHIEWLLRTQNDDGSWAKKGSGDQLRSHGVVNLLLWYDEHVRPDPRISAAVRRWYVLLLDEKRSAYLRVPGEGIATSLAGRALVEVIRPGVDCYRWKDDGH